MKSSSSQVLPAESGLQYARLCSEGCPAMVHSYKERTGNMHKVFPIGRSRWKHAWGIPEATFQKSFPLACASAMVFAVHPITSSIPSTSRKRGLPMSLSLNAGNHLQPGHTPCDQTHWGGLRHPWGLPHKADCHGSLTHRPTNPFIIPLRCHLRCRAHKGPELA